VGLKKILMLAGIGLAFFAVSLVLGWKINVPAAAVAAEPNEANIEMPVRSYINPMSDRLSIETRASLQSLSEKQLESLIFELREKLKANRQREQELAVQEERIRAAGEEVKGDLEKLSGLRTELAGTVSQIKREREALGKDRLTITAAEVAKLQQIASIHDKMDAASGSTLLVNMASNGRLDDAVQILNYMQERNAAKVLSEMVSKDPKVATVLCERLKKVREEKQ
jgi:pentatricopeptide repeat protein